MLKSIFALLVLFLIFSSVSHGKEGQAIAIRKASHYHKINQNNLALFYLFKHLKKQPEDYQKYEKVLEKIVNKTGTSPLYHYNINFLSKFPTATISLHIAHYLFKNKQYQESLKYLSNIPKKNSFYPEAMLLKGSIEYLEGQEGYRNSFDLCYQEGSRYQKMAGKGPYQRYFVLIKEQCQMNMARALYEQGDFEATNEAFSLIDKRSYSWPYLLLDQAWSYYKLEDYNRSLGLLMTYHSPLLSSYFFPEAEVLAALSYYRLCLYYDANAMIHKFYKIYKPQAAQIKKIIESASDQYYYALISDQLPRTNQYLLKLRSQLKKKLRLNLQIQAIKNIDKEMEALKGSQNKKDLYVLQQIQKNLKSQTALFVKEHLYHFINQINYFSFEMFNIKLEILSHQKDLLYEDKELIADRARGTFKGANITDQVFFYKFDGQFWADELGDYSFGLKSNCETILKEAEEE